MTTIGKSLKLEKFILTILHFLVVTLPIFNSRISKTELRDETL